MESAPAGDVRPRLGMLHETYDLALETVGGSWPTPAMALGSLFERAIGFLEGGGQLLPLREPEGPMLEQLNQARDELFDLETQYHVVNYVTFVLTAEGETLESTWLQLADRHLQIRAEIVESRREEERLKRELNALGVLTVPLPEHEELPAVSADRPRKRQGVYAHLFVGAATADAELQIDPARVETADRLAQERGWIREWSEHARLLVFTHGLSLALREREAAAIDPSDPATIQAAQAKARRRLMLLEGRYSTLRLRLFDLRHNHRILGWRITALEIEEQGMRQRLELFRRDRARLEGELAARRAEPGPTRPNEADRPIGWRTRIARLFGSGGDP